MKDKDLKQPRFFCENCKRELFLAAKYCDSCGGEIEWPEKYGRLFSTLNDKK